MSTREGTKKGRAQRQTTKKRKKNRDYTTSEGSSRDQTNPAEHRTYRCNVGQCALGSRGLLPFALVGAGPASGTRRIGVGPPRAPPAGGLWRRAPRDGLNAGENRRRRKAPPAWMAFGERRGRGWWHQVCNTGIVRYHQIRRVDKHDGLWVGGRLEGEMVDWRLLHPSAGGWRRPLDTEHCSKRGAPGLTVSLGDAIMRRLL